MTRVHARTQFTLVVEERGRLSGAAVIVAP